MHQECNVTISWSWTSERDNTIFRAWTQNSQQTVTPSQWEQWTFHPSSHFSSVVLVLFWLIEQFETSLETSCTLWWIVHKRMPGFMRCTGEWITKTKTLSQVLVVSWTLGFVLRIMSISQLSFACQSEMAGCNVSMPFVTARFQSISSSVSQHVGRDPKVGHGAV